MSKEVYMSNVEQKLPPVAQLIAVLLVANGILGLWALSQTLIGGSSVISLPSLGGGHESVIAYMSAGVGFGCFLIAGIALLVRRKRAIFLYLMGAIFYAVYIAVAFLVFFVKAAWQSVVAGNFSAGDAVFLAIVFVGGGAIGFFVARAIYNYLQNLSGEGVLR